MRPRLASLVFTLIVVLAVGALAWGATRGKSTGSGIGSAKDQAAARTTLQTGLTLSGGLVRDPTFTACGGTADACFTGTTSLATTLAALATVVHSAGGSLPDVCSAVATGGGSGPRFTCLVTGRLHGTSVVFVLGEGWSFPGNPKQRTAVVGNVEKSDPTKPTPAPATAGSATDVTDLLPAAWARAPQPCAGATTSSAPSPAPSTPSASGTTSAAPLLADVRAAACVQPERDHLQRQRPLSPQCCVRAAFGAGALEGLPPRRQALHRRLDADELRNLGRAHQRRCAATLRGDVDR